MDELERQNPFALVKASDFSDAQIHELWVELGAPMINKIIEPRLRTSKYILGGKGTGKTHLLRYHSYQVARLRYPSESGLDTVKRQKYLGIFIRAANVDPGRFEPDPQQMPKWQRLFGVYLELWLAERLLEALIDVGNSKVGSFNDKALIDAVESSIHGGLGRPQRNLQDLIDWVRKERRSIDHAVDNAAFSGVLDVRVSFSIGGLCAPLGRALTDWNPAFAEVALIFMVDEIENFSAFQQEVLNSLIRYAEGVITFRVTGRLYSVKTTATMSKGEENREGAEFKTTTLDDLLRDYPGYSKFAEKFVKRRLSLAKATRSVDPHALLDPTDHLAEVDASSFYSKAIEQLGLDSCADDLARRLLTALANAEPRLRLPHDIAMQLAEILFQGLPLLLQRLNLLLFCKKYRRPSAALDLALELKASAEALVESGGKGSKETYSTAYQHYAKDLFAQVCRESKIGGPLYAGFELFVKISSGNPRNLLILLGRMQEMALFKEMRFDGGRKLSVRHQTDAAVEAARFILESDTNYGAMAERAHEAVTRLALTLRTARFALNIPEVSPLAVSFASDDLSEVGRATLNSALNYSLLFEVPSGRPDRNSQKLLRKVQLNPLLSARWGLPVSRRGDLSLGGDLSRAIFEPAKSQDFHEALRGLDSRWNNPFSKPAPDPQPTLF